MKAFKGVSDSIDIAERNIAERMRLFLRAWMTFEAAWLHSMIEMIWLQHC